MNILAVELSTAVGSLALLEGQRLLWERVWREDELRRQHFFSVLAEEVGSGRLDWTKVDTLAVGLGPGNFTGLRAAVMATLAVALPDQRRVVGVSSCEALALDILRETGAENVAVFGDARRQQMWGVRYKVRDGGLGVLAPLTLMPRETVAPALADAAVWVTPDWERIGAALRKLAGPHVRFLNGPRLPRARTVGELACGRIGVRAGERVAPIYVHPPVEAERTVSRGA